MSLENIFGYLHIPENTLLYHTTNDVNFKLNKEKPFLFTTLHPIDWGNKYIVKIKLLRNIKVLFMIDKIECNKNIISGLPILINNNSYNSDLNKQKDTNLIIYKKYLEIEKLDGWFSSIENGSTVEVALLNNNFFEISNICEYIYIPYIREKNIDNCFEPDPIFDCDLNNKIKTNICFGEKYELSFVKNKINFYLNHKYKKYVDDIKRKINIKFIESTFDKLIMHSIFHFFNSEEIINNFWV